MKGIALLPFVQGRFYHVMRQLSEVTHNFYCSNSDLSVCLHPVFVIARPVRTLVVAIPCRQFHF